MHCAQMRRADWSYPFEGPEKIGPPPEGADWGEAVGVCPGAVLEHPFIQEAVHARVAMEGGSLTTFIPDPSHALLEGVLILKSAFNLLEHQRVRKDREKRQDPPPHVRLPVIR
jgi:hypothetical protein